MSKFTPGPWFNREGTIVADTRDHVCCGRPCVGAEYMGQQEMVCCGNPDTDGDAEDEIATVKYECDIPLVTAAPDMLRALQVILSTLDALEEMDNLRHIARAAITRATGEQP